MKISPIKLKASIILLIILQIEIFAQQKPNIILFVVDDLGWTDVGCYSSDLHQTPHIDELASQGTKFTNAYTSCTVCSPTRASIMTGKYPARIHCTDWITGHKKPFAKMKIPNWTMYMAPEETTLAEALQNEGYSTIHIGKWHLGEEEKYWPENQGFDVNIGGWKAGAPQKGNGGNGYFPPYLNPRLSDGPNDEYLTERLCNEALAYLEQTKDNSKPFFMNFWFYNVHTPLQAKADKIKKYEALVDTNANHSNPVYAAMVEHVDDAIGRVIDKLKDTGLDKNTIIIFTSDNGGLCGNYENNRKKVTNNTPLRSGKGDMYEGGVRVPFIVFWPDNVPKGKVSETPVISMDIYPTLLGLIGEKNMSSESASLDGKDLSAFLQDNTPIERKALYWHYPHYHLEGAKPFSAIRKGDWKLIEIFEHDSLELYNLKDDIGEQDNLATQYPEKVKELYTDLEDWRKEVSAQMPVKNPMYKPLYEEEWKWRDESDKAFLKKLQSANK